MGIEPQTADSNIGLFGLPSELLLQVASQLEVEDILSLRKVSYYRFKFRSRNLVTDILQVNHAFFALTKQKNLWLGYIRSLQDEQCTPLVFSNSASNSCESSNHDYLDTNQLERIVLCTHLTERRWKQPRVDPPGIIHSSLRESMCMVFFEPVWVLSITRGGEIALLDTRSSPPNENGAQCRWKYQLPGPYWQDPIARLTDKVNRVITILARLRDE